jgi:zinc finger protein
VSTVVLRTTRFNQRVRSGVSFFYSPSRARAAESAAAEGTVYTARIRTRGDLNRQLVKSPTCTVILPEFELTLPPGRGQLTTVEGLLRDVILDLETDQPVRQHMDPENHAKIQALINKLRAELSDAIEDVEETAAASGSVVHHVAEGVADDSEPIPPFSVRVDDPTGNSFLEFLGGSSDPQWNMRTYARTREQNIELGLVAPEEQPKQLADVAEADETGLEPGRENEEIFVFPGVCPSCAQELNTNMKKVAIPYFQVGMGSPSRSIWTDRATGYPDHVDQL